MKVLRARPIQASSRHEQPVFFRAGGQSLFGILTRPVAESIGTTLVLLPGGAGTRDSVNRNRVWVNLSRWAAGAGCSALRFDYHGAGESTGRMEILRLDRPFVDDVRGALDCAEDQGQSNFVLVGSCYGARAALACAPQVRSLRGLVLASPYLRDFSQGERVATLMAVEWSMFDYVRRTLTPRVLLGLLDRERRRTYGTVARAKGRAWLGRLRGGAANPDLRVSPNFWDPFETVVRRGVPILLLHGEDDDAYEEFNRARAGRLGALLEEADSLIEVATVPGKLHGLSTVQAQEAMMERVGDWLVRRGFAATSPGG